MKAERVFADTNLFLRYLTNDVPAQAEAVESLLRGAEKGQIMLVTTSLAIAEIIWTLENYYRIPREDIREKVLAILNTPGLEVTDSDLILQSVFWYAEKNVDFIDAFNAAWMARIGVGKVYTFDQKHFERFAGVELLTP